MLSELKNVQDEESRLEYLYHLKQPDEKGSTKKRLGLLFQNQSLIIMQFMSKDKIPSEEQIMEDIKQAQSKAGAKLREFIDNCISEQKTLIEKETKVEAELAQLEQDLILDISTSYSKISEAFSKFQTSLATQVERSKLNSEDEDESMWEVGSNLDEALP